jgi:hypothetical protein
MTSFPENEAKPVVKAVHKLEDEYVIVPTGNVIVLKVPVIAVVV